MAVKVSGVSLKVEGAASFKAELDKANAALRKNKAEMDKLDATYGKGSTDKEYLTQKQEQLTARLEAQKQRTEALRQAREAYATQADATAEGMEKLDLSILKSETQEAAYQRQLTQVTDALREQDEASQEAKQGQEQLGKSAKQAAQEAEAAAQRWEENAKKVSAAGKKLTTAVTMPIVGVGKTLTKEALALEDAMYTVATLPGVAVEELPAYTKAILAASDATGVAAQELAAAQYQAISAGQAAESSVDFVEKAAKAAKAGLTDTSTVVDGATSILNAWGEAAGGVDHVLDALAVTQNEGKTTIGDVAGQIGQLTGLAPQLNIALDDTLAAVAALTKNGVGTSQAINGLKAVMSNVIKPTTEAGKAAKQLGLDFSATALESKGLSGFLSDVMEKTGGDTEVLAQLFGSVEGLNQVMLLGGAAAGDYAQILGKIGTAAGAMEAAFSTRTSSGLEKLNASMNKLKNAGMGVAENLTPAVDAVTNLLGGVGDALGSMDAGSQQALVGLLGVTAATGPVLSATGKLMELAPKLKAAFSGPVGWITLAAGGLAALGIHLAGLKSPIDELITSIDGRLESLDVSVSSESVAAMTAAINGGIDAAQKEHELTVKINTQINEAGDMAENAFADGKMDYQEYKGFSTWVNTYVVPDIQAGKKKVAEERKAFIDALNGKVGEDGEPLTNAEKQEMADAAVAPMQAIVTQLENAKNDYQALLQEIYRNGGTATEEEMARMDELLVRIGTYQTELGILQDNALTFMHQQYDNVVAGYGTDTEVGGAVGFIGESYRQALLDAQTERAALTKERTEAVSALREASAGEEEMNRAVADYEAAMAALDSKDAQAAADMMAGYNEIFAGVARQNPEQAAWLKQASETITKLGELKAALDMLDAKAARGELKPEDMLPYQTEDWMDFWGEAVPGTSPYAMMSDPNLYYSEMREALAKAMEQAATELEGMTAEGDQAGTLMAALQSILTDVDMGSLDASQATGAFADALRLQLVTENGLDAIGTEAMDAIGGGAQAGAAEAGQAAGGALMGSIAGGIDGEKAEVLAALRGLMDEAQAAVSAGIGIPVFPVYSGFAGGAAGGTAGGAQAGNSYATNVTIMRADMTSRASIDALANSLDALSRARNAGVGIVK